MSPRKEVTRERLVALFDAIGRRFRHPARLYLSGGESLVWRCIRGATKDVDIRYDVADEFHGRWVETLRDLKEELSMSIEEAHPGDFIPTPPGSDSRTSFIDRFGQVDVYLEDPYAIALSKIERCHERDLQDVRSLLSKGIIEADELRRLFDAILPRYERQSVKSDPARFRRGLEAALA